MSSITIFARGDRAVMLTDTAGTDPHLVVRAWVSKVAALPHVKVALTVQGAAEAASTFANELSAQCATFDEMITGGAPLLSDLHDENLMRWSDIAACPMFRMGIVGWSDSRRRFEAYTIASEADADVPAFVFKRRDVAMAPVVHDNDLAALGIPKDGAAFAANAEQFLLRIIRIQRHGKTPRLRGEGRTEGHVIGGQVVATVLTPEGVSHRVIHQWSDSVDEPIQPGPIKAELATIMGQQPSRGSVVPTTGTSRQQRRAAARAARAL